MTETLLLPFDLDSPVPQAPGAIRSPERAGSWRVELSNGKPFPVRAAIDGPWLVLRSPVASALAGSPWETLCLSGQLPGLCKLVREAGELRLGLEAPMGEEHSCTPPLPELHAALVEAHEVIARDRSSGEPALPTAASAPSAQLADQCERLLAEAGWPMTRQAEAGCLVKLQARGGYYQAEVEPSDGDLRIRAELAAERGLPSVCRSAIGVLLLTASAELRLVRAAAESGGPEQRVRLEVRLPAAPDPGILDLALGGLSFACEHFGRETKVLTSEAAARRYLIHFPLTPGD